VSALSKRNKFVAGFLLSIPESTGSTFVVGGYGRHGVGFMQTVAKISAPYADSDLHMNKEWQGYATMAAAAYAKDLLCQIFLQQVEAERKISEIYFSQSDYIQLTRNHYSIANSLPS
jgi:hypothetical protein